MTFKIVLISSCVIFNSCRSLNPNMINKQLNSLQIDTINPIKEKENANSELVYVIYGYFCGECNTRCTRMYKHMLIDSTNTFWTDNTDSYFTEQGLKFETRMNQESEKFGFELINNIPNSILKVENTRNIFGCPDCDDRCGLYFEYKLKGSESEPIIYEMEYNLKGTTDEVKDLGEWIKKTVEKLENYR